MALATLTDKGQITIPKQVRDSLGLHSGDKVEFILMNNGEALVRPVTKRVDEVFGILHKKRKPVSLEEMDQAIAQKLKDEFL